MYKSITIENFRCFDFITLDRLERINLIGGTNNVGKTALLEAFFLRFGLNSLELPLRLNILRGMVRQETFDLQDICQWLFYDRRSDRAIQIITTDEAAETGYWNWDSQAFDPLKQFILSL